MKMKVRRTVVAVVLAAAATVAGIEISGVTHQAKAKTPATHAHVCACIARPNV